MDRLFTDAQAGNAILFFDECDALLRQAHDGAVTPRPLRQHRDRVLLTEAATSTTASASWRPTCARTSTPRSRAALTFIVEFPFPRRRQPAADLAVDPGRRDAAQQDLDLDFMATQFKLPAAPSRSIAVAAAFLAAAGPQRASARNTCCGRPGASSRKPDVGSAIEFGRYGERMDGPRGWRCPAVIHESHRKPRRRS